MPAVLLDEGQHAELLEHARKRRMEAEGRADKLGDTPYGRIWRSVSDQWANMEMALSTPVHTAWQYRMLIIHQASLKMPGMPWAEAKSLAMDEIAVEWGMIPEPIEEETPTR